MIIEAKFMKELDNLAKTIRDIQDDYKNGIDCYIAYDDWEAESSQHYVDLLRQYLNETSSEILEAFDAVYDAIENQSFLADNMLEQY